MEVTMMRTNQLAESLHHDRPSIEAAGYSL
jgi:hypothetical protein